MVKYGLLRSAKPSEFWISWYSPFGPHDSPSQQIQWMGFGLYQSYFGLCLLRSVLAFPRIWALRVSQSSSESPSLHFCHLSAVVWVNHGKPPIQSEKAIIRAATQATKIPTIRR